MKLPELEHPETYNGLYVFDFGDHVAVGYTADEVATLLESEQYRDGKVYRIHRALPDGTFELQGVSRAQFEAEDGLLFYRSSLEAAHGDLESLKQLVEEESPPCRMKAQLIELPGEPTVFVTAIVYPAEFSPDVSDWLLRHNYQGGDYVEGGTSQVTNLYEANTRILERDQFWPARSTSRPAEEVIATTHLAIQRVPA
jgi:hypothetical protein